MLNTKFGTFVILYTRHTSNYSVIGDVYLHKLYTIARILKALLVG